MPSIKSALALVLIAGAIFVTGSPASTPDASAATSPDYTFKGLSPTRLVPFDKGVIAYYDQPTTGNLTEAQSKAVEAAAVPGTLAPRACGDNTVGGYDTKNHLAPRFVCDYLISYLNGQGANLVSNVGQCYYQPDPVVGQLWCCTTWRGGFSVPGWALVNGARAIRDRCAPKTSGGNVSGWIDIARLNGQCTAQCLSSEQNGC